MIADTAATPLVQVRDLAMDMVVAWRGKRRCAKSGVWRCAAYRCQSCVDMLGVGHAHEHMESWRSELLEVTGFALFDERIQEMTAVQRVGLQPFLSIGLSRGSRMYDHPKSSGHEILDDSLTDQRR